MLYLCPPPLLQPRFRYRSSPPAPRNSGRGRGNGRGRHTTFFPPFLSCRSQIASPLCCCYWLLVAFSHCFHFRSLPSPPPASETPSTLNLHPHLTLRLICHTRTRSNSTPTSTSSISSDFHRFRADSLCRPCPPHPNIPFFPTLNRSRFPTFCVHLTTAPTITSVRDARQLLSAAFIIVVLTTAKVFAIWARVRPSSHPGHTRCCLVDRDLSPALGLAPSLARLR